MSVSSVADRSRWDPEAERRGVEHRVVPRRKGAKCLVQGMIQGIAPIPGNENTCQPYCLCLVMSGLFVG